MIFGAQCMLFMLPSIAGGLGFLLAPDEAHIGRLICFWLCGSCKSCLLHHFTLHMFLERDNKTLKSIMQRASKSTIRSGLTLVSIDQTTFVLSLSLITSNIGGMTKRMIITAAIWIGVCVGNLAGPYLYLERQAPKYQLGIGSLLVANGIELVIIFLLRWVFIRSNREKEQQAKELVADGRSEAVPHENETAFKDLTDKENPK